MKVRFILSIIMGSIFVALGVPSIASSKTPPASAEAFAAPPAFSDVAVSSDGNRIAFGVSTAAGGSEVRIFDMLLQRTVAVDVGDNKLSHIQFEDGGDLLITARSTDSTVPNKVEVSRTFAVDFETGKLRRLLTRGGDARQYNSGVGLASILPDEANQVMMTAYEFRASAGTSTLNLYKVATDGVKVETVDVGSDKTYDWLTDRSGKPIARADHDPIGKITTLLLRNDAGQWREALVLQDTPSRGVNLVGLSKQGRVLFFQNNEADFTPLYSLDPKSAQVNVFLRGEDVEVSSVYTDPWGDQIIGIEMGGLNPEYHMLVPELQKAQATLQSTFPGKMVTIVSFSRDQSTLVAQVESASDAGGYFLLKQNGPTITELRESRPALKDQKMGSMQATTFKARDGAEIPVYVTLPPSDQDIKNAPTIIFPHGGPAARNEPYFDYWKQFMATRGYVVIQPQFRGSTGFGRAHEEAGRQQWGKRMQDDVSDSVAWAVKQGLSDPKRVCIVGASYGGYAALAGATLTPDLYRCAAAIAGVSDLPIMIEQEKEDAGTSQSSSVNYWVGHIGADDPQAMIAASPRRLVNNVKAPILLMHGRDDTIVRFEQSSGMASALKSAGKNVKLVELRGEDHWLSKTATRQQMLTELEAFLREHLGPGVN